MKQVNENMKVSIVTVVYNGVKTIERAIQSVIKQDYSNIEYIIIDGGSTDGTQDVILKYINYISFYVSERDKGIYDAMNKGAMHANGDVIGFLNCDDWYERHAIEHIVENFNNNVEIVSGQVRFVYDNKECFISEKNDIESIWERMPVMHPATFVRLLLFREMGMFDIGYKIAADYDFIFKLYVSGIRFRIIDDVIANFCMGGISTRKIVQTTKESNSIRLKYAKDRMDTDRILAWNKKELDIACLNEIMEYQSEKLAEYIKKKLGNSIEIFGCGYWGKKVANILSKTGISIGCFYDNNPAIWTKFICNILVNSPNKLKDDMAIHQIVIAVWESDLIDEQIKGYANPFINMISIRDMLMELKRELGMDTKD